MKYRPVEIGKVERDVRCTLPTDVTSINYRDEINLHTHSVSKRWVLSSSGTYTSLVGSLIIT